MVKFETYRDSILYNYERMNELLKLLERDYPPKENYHYIIENNEIKEELCHFTLN